MRFSPGSHFVVLGFDTPPSRAYRRRARSAAAAFAVWAGLLAASSLHAQPYLGTLDIWIAASADDAEEETSSGTVYLSSSDLELVEDAGTLQTVGLRFPGLNIPVGSTITAAWVQFAVDESQNVATSLTIEGQASDNAPAFTSAGFAARPRTTASVGWSPAAWTTIGQAGSDQRTPGLAAILQEIVNRPGWLPGRAVALFVTGSGHRTAEAFDGVPALAPLLHVEFSSPTPPPLPQTVTEIHWTFTGQTSVAFNWRGTHNVIRYGLTPAYGDSVVAVTPSPLPFSSAGPFWEARLQGLVENTLYHYSIGGGGDATFRTPPQRGTSGFTFFAEGDIGASSVWPEMGQVQDLIASVAPDFVLGLGDLTYGNTVGQYIVEDHFEDVQVWSLNAAYMPIWGNHEWDPGDDLRNYKGRFHLPNARTSPGAPAEGCCGEDWYWFDYGNVRFIAVPEPYSSASRADWEAQVPPLMAAAQADPAITFIVTFGHRPAYSSGFHQGEPYLQVPLDALGDAYDKYVLHLNGHSHNYERSHPQHGVVHVTSGTGGSSLESETGPCVWTGGCPPPAWSAYRAMHHVALRIDVTATTIMGQAICGPATTPEENDVTCAPGTVIDTWIISRGSTNAPPVVNAGPDQTITLPAAANLDGSATDDGLPGPLTVTWSVVSGPGPVTFVDAAAIDTQAGFTTPGSYLLELLATDGLLADRDSVTIVVEAAGGFFLVLDRQIAAGSDDAEEGQTGPIAVVGPDLTLGGSGNPRMVGLRFTNVTIPPGGVVLSAHAQFEADEVHSGSTNLVIEGEASDQPEAFAPSARISSRPRTAASAAWTPAAWTAPGQAGSAQRTTELAAIVQEIVNRPGWASGNPLVLILSGLGSRVARSWEGRVTGAARLHVEYLEGALDVAPGVPGADRLRVHPSPARGVVRVAGFLGAGPATIELLDVTGRRVLMHDLGAPGPGWHQIELRPMAPAGLYFVRLAHGGVARTRKVLLLE